MLVSKVVVNSPLYGVRTRHIRLTETHGRQSVLDTGLLLVRCPLKCKTQTIYTGRPHLPARLRKARRFTASPRNLRRNKSSARRLIAAGLRRAFEHTKWQGNRQLRQDAGRTEQQGDGTDDGAPRSKARCHK